MASTRDSIMAVLADGEPKSHRDIAGGTGLSHAAVWSALLRLWRAGRVMRTKKAIYGSERAFKGRAGSVNILRSYYLYVLKPAGMDRMTLDGREFVVFSKKYLDPRGRGGVSKAGLVLNFLRKNRERAWFSKEVADALKDRGVKPRDVMSNVRRWEKKGLVYVRGYRTEERQTPFREGYLITWVDQSKPREQALGGAIKRTDLAIEQKRLASPFVQRIHMIRDIVIESSKLGELVGTVYIRNKLGCSESQAEGAIARAMQLYPDLRQVKLFNAYRYFYRSSVPKRKFEAAVKMKENYVRMTKGRDNRIGHNWEAVVEWFIDRYTTGARFWEQKHRTSGMDRRRITIFLIKPVGGRRSSAEVDRVWEVTSGLLEKPITYVLSCKWGLVNRDHVNDFLDVIRWSKEFGADTSDGRRMKQGVVGVFAASSFNPREKVKLRDGTEISLAAYANRMNVQLLKAVDLNGRLRDRGCPPALTVQRVCRVSKNEKEVRGVLDAIWTRPKAGQEVLDRSAEKNKDLYKFEKMLAEGR